MCSQAGGILVYPRFSQPDNSESWMMPVTASDKQNLPGEVCARNRRSHFDRGFQKQEDKLVDLPLYAIEQIAEL